MKIGIDSYCYHRYFGEIYDFQQDPGKRITFDHFLKRSNELGVDVVSLETCFFPENDQDFLKKLKDQIIEFGLDPVVAWGHPVSYTHLDVYKRQVQNPASSKFVGLKNYFDIFKDPRFITALRNTCLLYTSRCV